MKTNTLFQVRFKPSVKPPRGFTKSAHYNVTAQTDPFIGKNEYLIGNTWLPAKDFIKIEIEDAPVFNKPPLRKIASLKHDEVIECNTEAELKVVLEQAEREGLKIVSGEKPTQYNAPEPPLCIDFDYNGSNGIGHGHLGWFKNKSYTILPASKFVEVAAEGKPEQVEIDRPIESYKPFPYDYEIPENTRIVVIESHLYSGENSTYIKAGETGVTIDKSTCPDVKFDSGILHHNGKTYLDILSHNLAPLDDRDHPEHPEFGKNKQEETKSYCEQVTITQAQKDECTKLQERIKELEKQIQEYEGLTQRMQDDIDSRADYEERMERDLGGMNETIERFNKVIAVSQEAIKSENETLHSVILRSIANGEI